MIRHLLVEERGQDDYLGSTQQDGRGRNKQRAPRRLVFGRAVTASLEKSTAIRIGMIYAAAS
jgi:hypothetical protein